MFERQRTGRLLIHDTAGSHHDKCNLMNFVWSDQCFAKKRIITKIKWKIENKTQNCWTLGFNLKHLYSIIGKLHLMWGSEIVVPNKKNATIDWNYIQLQLLNSDHPLTGIYRTINFISEHKSKPIHYIHSNDIFRNKPINKLLIVESALIVHFVLLCFFFFSQKRMIEK